MTTVAPPVVLNAQDDLRKAGLRRDAIGSQCFDVLEAQEKGDRQCFPLLIHLHSNLLGTTRDFPSCFDVQSTFSVYFGLAFLDSTRP